MARFEALDVWFQMSQALCSVLKQIQQHDRDLALQLRRAGASAPSCLSEGSQRVGRDRLHLYRIAGGSAAEVLTQLELAIAWGYVARDEAQPVIELADRVVAIVWRLTHPHG